MSDTEDNIYKPPHIKYGAIISISHFQDDNAFIYADGHVKREVSLKSFSLYKRAEQLKQLEKQRKMKSRIRKSERTRQNLGGNVEQQQQQQNYQNRAEQTTLLKMDEDDYLDEEDEYDDNVLDTYVNDEIQGIQNHITGQNQYNNSKHQSLVRFEIDENADVDAKMKFYSGMGGNTEQILQVQENIERKQKAAARKKLRQERAKKLEKKNFNQNKQSFSNCLFMIFPKLSNTQKNRVVKNLGYESEDSDDELDDAETIFINPYDQNIQIPGQGQGKTSIETQMMFRKIQTLTQPASPKDEMKKGKTFQEEQKEDKLLGDVEEEEEENKDYDVLDKDNLDKQKINLLNEYKANFDTYKKSQDSTVSFNSVIQLLHLNSAKWLAIKPIEARYQKENFRMTLEAYTSENTMLKIMPAFKYQKDGEQTIFANEIVYISRAQDINNRSTFLNISQEINVLKQSGIVTLPPQVPESNLTTQFQIQGQSQKTIQNQTQTINKQSLHMPSLLFNLNDKPKLFLKDQPEKKAQISSIVEPIHKREINGSQETQTNFKLNLFQENYTDFQQNLKCGDVIWLHHSEATGQIGVQRKDKGVNKHTFTSMNLKTWMALDNLELKVLGTGKQSSQEQYSGDTFGMWQIESQKLSDGGYVEFDTLYRLKHLSSGYFLCIQKKPTQEKLKSNDINEYYQLGLIEVPDSSSLFRFDCLLKDRKKSPYVQLNSYVYIQNKNYKYYLDVEVDESEIQKLGNKFSQLSYPKLKVNLNEKLLFKIYQADKNEVWEINYVISCFSYLVKLALNLEDKAIESKNDEKLMFSQVRKIKKAIKCIIDLTRFCENKVYNISPQQKFGSANSFRQKLLREQYFIDLLIKILESSLPKHELDMWIKQQDSVKTTISIPHNRNKSQAINPIQSANRLEQIKTEAHSTQDFFMKGGDSFIDQSEYVAYINWKVTLSKLIYKLLESICSHNGSNQLYTFELLPYFQIHAKYIPEAVDCITNICSSNEQLLLKLSENLQIQYDFNDNNYVKEDMSRTVKFFINLYDGNAHSYKESNKENKMDFAQHEKLTCKPINLINFFMNLLWDDKATNKSDYMRFLSGICFYKNKGITINQENIFKLFKKFSSIREGMKLELQIKNGRLERIHRPQDLEKTCQHIMFYANLSYGRNYLWRQQLMNQFKSEDLFTLIWDPSVIKDENQQKLSSSLCRLAQTLYIDHEPLNRVYKPNYCRLFSDVPIKTKKKENSFLQQQQSDQNEGAQTISQEEMTKYSKLLTSLKEYLIQIKLQIDEQARIFNPDKQKGGVAAAQPVQINASPNSKLEQAFSQLDQIPTKPKNITGSEVLETIMDLLDLLLHLDIYTIVQREADYGDLLNCLIRLLQYDRVGIKFMSALYLTELQSNEKKQQSSSKSAALTNIAGGVCDGITAFIKLITDVLQPKPKKAKGEDQNGNMFEFRSIDDNMLFNNPIMKGFVKLSNLIEAIMYADNESIQLENKIKGKICEILDRFLSFRQDYLLSNSMCFFKKVIFKDKQETKIRKQYDIWKQNESIGKKSWVTSSLLGSENLKGSGGEEQEDLEGLDMDVDKMVLNRSRVDSNTPLNQKRLSGQQKKSSFKPKAGTLVQAQTISKEQSKEQQPQIKGQDRSRLSSFFGIRSTKPSAIAKPIDEQFTDWWVEILLSYKKKMILPKIALTGLPEVDKIYQEQDELIKVLNFTEEVVQPKFKNYIKDQKKIMPDFDTLLSAKNIDGEKSSVSSALPSLLCTFLLVQDQHLEIKVLNIIMRLFNQRFELIENLGELQIIFDQNKTQLFKFLKSKFLVVQKYIEKSEIWFQTLEKKQNVQLLNAESGEPTPSNIGLTQKQMDKLMDQNDDSPFQFSKGINIIRKSNFYEKEHDAYKIYKLIESIRNGLFTDITLHPNQDEFGQSITCNSTIIDFEKQKIHKYLKLYDPIITLIKDGMTHFDKIIMSENYTILTKRLLFNLFREAFGYLKNFVEKNGENQILINEYIHFFITDLQYDLGQIDLICEIYRDNIDLIGKISNELIQTFIDLIEHEGRQDKFLDFFLVIQKSKQKMIFENQLLVLNSFLPMDGLSELEVKLTYSDGAKKTSDIQFYFEDSGIMEDQNLIDRMIEVEFRDTYLDQPFRYHAKLLNCLLYSTLQANVDIADPLLNITKDHFNISVAKLKKTFSFYYLLEVLQKEDDFVTFSDFVYQDEQINLEQLKSSAFYQDKELRKKGFSFLKPYVADFIKIVHIFSDSQSTENLYGELSFTQKEFSQFMEKEGMRFVGMPEDQINMRYVSYICINIIGMVQAYFDKYLKKYVDKHSTEDEERRDLIKVREFVENVTKKMKSSRIIRKQLPDYDMHFEKAKNLQRSFKTQNIVQNNEDLEDDFFETFSHSSRSKDDSDEVQELEVSLPQGRVLLASPKQYPSSILKQDQKSNLLGNDKKGLNVRLDKDISFSQRKDSVQAGLTKEKSSQSNHDIAMQCEYQELHWKQFVVAMNNSPLVMEQVETEVKAFADAILNIESYIQPQFQRFIDPKLDLNLILKKFIKFLQFSLKVGTSKQTTLTLLNVLKTIVEKDPEDLVNRQDQLDKLGASQMVLIILSEYSHQLDGELYINFIQFLNTLLKGGNACVQKTVYSYFINQTKSEVIFDKFNYFIRKQIDFIEQEAKVKKRKEEEKKGKFKNVGKDDFEEAISQIVDNDQEKEEGDEGNSFTHTQDVVILDSILDFLSLVVTGHYTEMQDYLREQYNLRSNNDMVQSLADLFKAYYNDGGQRQYYEGMVKCIETLIKFVQGPCVLNQQAISDSKFFDVVHDLFEREMKHRTAADDGKSQFTTNRKSALGGSKIGRQSAFKSQSAISKSRVSSGDEPLENWQIARLQYKSLCLIHSLLEGCSVKVDNSIIKKIARNIQIDTIEKRIVEVYANFDDIYQGDYIMKSLDHITFDPSNPKDQENPYFKKNQEKYSHTIIQNAFMLYILFCLYMESGERIESHILGLYKNQYKKNILGQKNALIEFLTGDNLIGNIFTFVKSFVESSIKTAQSLQNEATKQMKKIGGGGGSTEEEDEAAKRIRQAKMQEKFKENLKKAVSFLFKNTAHIEVLRSDQLETIYFMLLPFCQRLPKEKKKDFNEQVDRSNEKQKVTGLMKESDYLLDVCRQEEELNKFFMSNKFISLFANYVKLWKDVAFILTIVLNIFNLLTFTSKFGDKFFNQHLFLDEKNYSIQRTNSIITLLGSIMTCCSMFVVSFFLVKNLPILIKRIWGENNGKKSKLFQKPPLLLRLILWLYKFIKIILGLLQEIEIIYYICYGTLAILGTVVHPFFFTFHLTEIFIRFPTLKSVVNAVYIPRKNLILTYLLYLIFIWLFTLFAYVFFQDDLGTDCSTLAYCFTLLIDQTFKSNGGIGGYVTGNKQGTDKDGNRLDGDFFKPGRFFFDNLFNLLVVIILVQIVAGQIIDQFGELREDENSKIEDTQGKCFICGIKSDLFDKKADKSNRGGFFSHIKENHYMWNYVFYLGYLRSQNPLEYSGIEQYIHSMVQDNDSGWFPTNRSSDLDLEEDDSKKEMSIVGNIIANADYLSEHSKNVLKSLKEIRQM